MGRVDGQVDPVVTRPKPGQVIADARFGFAQPAFTRGLPDAVDAARTNGVATLAVARGLRTLHRGRGGGADHRQRFGLKAALHLRHGPLPD